MDASLTITGIPYRVSFNPNLLAESGALGRSTGNRALIELDPGAPVAVRHHTLVHEVIEQLNYLMDLGLSHHQVELLALGMYQVLAANDLQTIARGGDGEVGSSA